MALSREEIEGIARAVARRVVPAFKPCRCGLAMWKAHGHTDSLEEAIGAGNLAQLRTASRDMEKELATIDADCSVDITRAKARLGDLTEASSRGDWEVATRQLIELRVLTREPLDEAIAEKEGGNPGGTPYQEEGAEIARQLGNGVFYNGPWMTEKGFLGHTFTDVAVTGTTFVCYNLEDCRTVLTQKRKDFGAAPPTFS